MLFGFRAVRLIWSTKPQRQNQIALRSEISVFLVVDDDRNLERHVNELQRRKNDIVDVLDVIKTEKRL